MKLLTKEEETAHYHATLKGGILGGFTGLAVGAVGVVAASKRFSYFNHLTLPLKAFLITSTGTFAGIISADHASRAYEYARNPLDQEYRLREKERAKAEVSGMTFTQRAMEWGKQERYKIVGASWLASMVGAFALVNRNKFLSGPQKLVQARVYAQFLTLGVLVASAAFEISDSKNDTGHWETVQVVDPNDADGKKMIEKRVHKGGEVDSGDDFWKDMVAAEEERLKERDKAHKKMEQKEHKKTAKHEPKKTEKKKEEN